MFRTISNRSGLKETTIALTILATLSLVGCGTDMSVAPQYVSIENDDGGASEGELPLPSRRGSVEGPIGLTLVSISVAGGQIQWNAPSQALTAHIDLDGVRIADVSASLGGYTDNLAKRSGTHRYSVCFEQATKKAMSVMKSVEGDVMDTPGDGGRTDDRPEDGR